MAMETAAIYCRLSQDDGSVGESGSIQTQKTLLTQYCKEHHIKVSDYYCDDGWSGTSFRPTEFQADDHLIVDPPAAEVVREIFQMFADGVGYVRMTKILRSRGVLNPQAYFNQNNPDYYKNSDYWRKPYDWHATSIRVILNNPLYLGKVVFGRSKTKDFFDKRRVETPEEEWIVTENAHEIKLT